jgi:hypothetical protein
MPERTVLFDNNMSKRVYFLLRGLPHVIIFYYIENTSHAVTHTRQRRKGNPLGFSSTDFLPLRVHSVRPHNPTQHPPRFVCLSVYARAVCVLCVFALAEAGWRAKTTRIGWPCRRLQRRSRVVQDRHHTQNIQENFQKL